SNHPKDRQPPRSRTRQPDQKLSQLPMLEEEPHEPPLPRRIDPAPSTTTERKRGQHQHSGSSDQEILRHPNQQQEPRRIESSQRRKNLPLKRHSRRDDKSTEDPVLSHSQRVVRRRGRTLRVSSHLPSLKLDQTHSPWRGLRSRPEENAAS